MRLDDTAITLNWENLDQRIKNRIRYGSFVGDKLNYLYMETPKAACSTMKHLLMDLEGRQYVPQHIGYESSAFMAVHARNIHQFKHLFDLDSNARCIFLTSPDVVRFCVVRNPYARLVSAWADKIRQREPNYARLWKIIGQHFGRKSAETCPSFSDFVCWIRDKQDIFRCNHHWRAMTALLLPEIISYTHVLRTEQLTQELQTVLDLIAPGRRADYLLEKFKTNESLPLDWKSQYDEKTASLVWELYHKDFECYAYDKDSWKKTDSEESIDELKNRLIKLECAALAAIQTRNDLIFNLTQHLKSSTLQSKEEIQPTKKKKEKVADVFVLGDSHAAVFDSPKWRRFTPAICWNVTTVLGATLSGLNNPNSKTEAAPKFKKALASASGKLVIMLLGEVDTGYVIWYRAQRDGINPQIAAQKAVENYTQLIQSAYKYSDVIVISAPLPSLADNDQTGEIARIRSVIIATQLQRTQLTLWFNQQIEDFCINLGVFYLNLDRECLGIDGLLLPKYKHLDPNNHHYNPVPYRELLKIRLLPIIRKKIRKIFSQ